MRSIVVVAAAAVCVAAGCGSRAGNPQTTAPGRHRPNILIVVVDALRADRLGCYGYQRDTTPALDALARDPQAVLFRRHYVQGAATKSSTASLFTGLYVFQHGVTRGHLMRPDPQRPRFFPTQALGDGFETMAQRLRGLGYFTFGVVKSHHLDGEFGFDRGFDVYLPPSELSGEGNRVAMTIELMRQAPGPFFGYLHLSGCHHPFPPATRHAGFMQRYGLDAGFRYDEAARIEAGIDFTTAETRHAILEGEVVLDPNDVRFLNLVYDAQLRSVDEQLLAPLLQALEDMGRYDDTLVILTADHGEELYEHGGYAHGHALWEEIVHVPLIVKFPRGRRPPGLGREVDAVTQAVDLLPTLAAFAGGRPPDGLPGADIFAGGVSGAAFSETEEQWALVRQHHKLVDGDGTASLFDLASDPAERVNLAAAEAERVAALRQAAAALRVQAAFRPREAPVVETRLSAEAVEDLRSLGYIR
jgi:arylsulfatase A-like enzyme